jgi:tetratricopeptide (TPR) repeat protein
MAPPDRHMASPFTEIGKYQVVDRLGQGGMGTLYLARDPMLDRLVAIKVLRVEVDAADIRERFAREARSVSRLRHVNVVTVFEYGDHKGQPYLVMEYISGESMAEMIRRRAALSLERKLQMMDDLCAGLAYAHRARIVHRDIKPANLMIDQESGALKILDFGIARSLESSTTRFTHVVGTPSYMSPEQAAGRLVDQRSDIFSVGCVFYELISYRRAFDGDSPIAVMNKIANLDPTPLASLVHGVDPVVATIIDRAMQRDPSSRYQDLETLRKELGRVHRQSPPMDRPIDAGVPTLPQHTPKPAPDLERRRATQIRQHLDVARGALENGNLEIAVESCEQVLLLDAANARALTLLDQARAAQEHRRVSDLVRRGRQLLNERALSEAEDVLVEALRLQPADLGALALQRDLQEAHRQHEQARQHAGVVEQALGRARAFFNDGAFESAARAASEALAYAPNSAEAQALKERALAEIQLRQEDDEKRRAQAAVAAARSHVEHEQQRQLLAQKESAHIAEPHTVVLPTLGRAQVKSGPVREATRRWRFAVIGGAITVIIVIAAYAMRPATSPKQEPVASVPEPKGSDVTTNVAPAVPAEKTPINTGAATERLRRPSSSAAPQAADPRLAAAKAAYEQRNFVEAGRLYEEVLSRQPDNAVAAAGVRAVRAELERRRRTADSFIARGDALREARSYDDAIRSYEAALAEDPLNTVAAQHLEDTKAARARAESSAKEVEARRTRLLRQANVLLDAGLFTAAIATFDEILKINPSDSEALSGREKAVNLKTRPKFL